MSHSLPYVSAAFYLQKAVAIAPAVVRIRFTYVPKSSDVEAPDDGLNPANFKLSGSQIVDVTSVSKVNGDPQSLDVFLSVPLTPGLWNIKASESIRAFDDNSPLTSPSSLTFAVSSTKTSGPINGGAYSDTAADIIRKHLPPSFGGPAWDALIEGLALADAQNWENAQAAFDQMFVSTASGTYLDRQSSDRGISRPAFVGISDQAFSEYTVRTSADKLTAHAILQILETFYGTDAVKARLEAGTPEPYRMEDEDNLLVSVDGLEPVELVFRKSDFAQIGRATAMEVAASINRQFRALRFPANAGVRQDPATLRNKVVVYANSLGLNSSVCVFGGFADNSLQFPKLIDLGIGVGTQLSISNPSSGFARFSLLGHPTPAFAELEIGDCVNVWGDGFHEQNRGTYRIVDINLEWNGSWSQSFDVVNINVIEQPAAEIFDTDDLVVFRPTKSSPSNQSGVVVSQTSDGVHVVLPATTSVVQRTETSGAHPEATRTLTIQNISVSPSGTATITTEESHFLSINDTVALSGLDPVSGLPQKEGGSATSTASCPLSCSNTLDLPAGFVTGTGAKAAALGGDSVIVMGGSVDGVAQNGAAILSLTPSISGNGRYLATATAAEDMPEALSMFTATSLSGANAGKVLVVGGASELATSSDAYMYDSSADSWSPIVSAALSARHSHTATVVSSALGDECVLVYGGKSSDSTLAAGACLYKDGQFEAVSSLSGAAGRFDHSATALTDTKVLVAGGSSLSDVLSDSFVYDNASGTMQVSGKMAIARKEFSMVRLPSGAVMAVGGLGRNLSNETVNRAVHECEVFDKDTLSWRPAGKLRYARIAPVVAQIGKRVYVIGGRSLSGAPVKKVEEYNTATGEWSVLSSLSDTLEKAVLAGAVVGGLVVGFYEDESTVFVPKEQAAASPWLRQQLRVQSIPSTNQFTVQVPENGYLLSLTGAAYPFGASEAVSAGPYVWNPNEDPAITSVEAALMSPIAAGQQYSKLVLGAEQALLFPDRPGWLCINHGKDGAIVAVPYLGRISDNQLMLDYSFVFPFDAQENSTVTLLSGKGPFVPARPDQVGSLYVTASSSGRVIAQSAIESILATGLNDKLTVTVIYPGDKGLGNAGNGTTGQKISDKVAVWGGNDLDSELAAAREEE